MSAVQWWLGLVVPKRHARRAATRSLLKRQMRAHAAQFRQPAAGRPVADSPACTVRCAPIPQRRVGAVAQGRGERTGNGVCRGGDMSRASGDATLAAPRIGAAGARLPLLPEPMAGQRLPLRAKLFALRARRPGAAWRGNGKLSRSTAPAALPSVVRRRPGSGATAHRTRFAILVPDIAKEPYMTDIRRTLLWVVFTMSLVLLWDAWNKHTGQPSLFGAAPPRPAASAPPPVAGASQVGVPTPVAGVTVPTPVAGAAAICADRRAARGGRRPRQASWS